MSSFRSSAAAVMVAGTLFAVTPDGVVAETMEYQVTFESTWSAATHPIGFPPSPHFSGLIGGTHNDQVSFWDEGALASLGIKNMAELGGKNALTNEVNAAKTAGTADAVVSGGGIGTSPGMITKTFTVDDAFPLVTLVSMLAPSPDWFVGVSGLPLRESGAWLFEVEVPLHVYDAGTDSGPNYLSSNQPTVPPDPISENMSGPFATNNLVGTFTFVATGAVDVSEALPRAPKPLVMVGPNPFRNAAGFQIKIPQGRSGQLDVYSVRGRIVRNLFRGTTSEDSRVVTWNGRDSRGVPVPAGVYYVGLRADGALLGTEKVVMTR